MGFGGISIWQLLIILVIVLLIFGPKRLRNLGSELGGALKGFRKEMRDDESTTEEPKKLPEDDNIIDGNLDEPVQKTSSAETEKSSTKDGSA